MSFEIYDNRANRGSDMFIAVDSQSRLYLSQALQRELGCIGLPIELYLAYDKINKRIAIAKPDIVRLTNVRPFRFDGDRHYANAGNFLRDNRIPARHHRYYYDGREQAGDFKGWLTFRLEDYDAPDGVSLS